MKKSVRVIPALLFIPFALFLLVPAPAHAGLFTDTGKRKIKEILRSSVLAGTHAGIKVIALPSGKTIIEENGTKLFVPASNVKLLTAYAALKLLGSRYAFITEFAADASGEPATVRTLYLKGYGDPSATLADLNYQALNLSGTIKRVTGDIVVDNSYFDATLFGRGWMWDEGIVPWNAPIAPYALDGNCIDIYFRPAPREGDVVRVRSVPETFYAVVVASAVTAQADDIHILRDQTPGGDRYFVTGTLGIASPEKKWRCTVSRPGLYAGTVLKELLTRYGVKVDGRVYEGTASTAAVCVGRYASRNMADILRCFLKESDNLTGECLLKSMGAAECGPPGDAAKGIAAIKKVLAESGIRGKSYELADGSGLSTYNLLSPDILVRVLQTVYGDFSLCPEFMDAMAVAGNDGTLKDRLKESPLNGYVRAKSGNMSGVSCLSGYLQTRKGTLLAVSIMMNGFTGTCQPLRGMQDEILQVLWENY